MLRPPLKRRNNQLKKISFKKPEVPQISIEDFAEPQELFFPSESEQFLTGFMPDIIQEILDNLKAGMTLDDSAKLLNLPVHVVRKWYKENKGNFAYAVDHAQTKNKKHYVDRLNKGDRQAAWVLERKWKEEYSKEVTITINHRLIDNVAQKTVQVLIKYIKDPNLLREAGEELRQTLNAINVNALPAEVY